jgi:hypothetical protein
MPPLLLQEAKMILTKHLYYWKMIDEERVRWADDFEIEYNYDFEHKIVEEDSLDITMDYEPISDELNEQIYGAALAACEEHERANCRRPVTEDDGRY